MDRLQRGHAAPEKPVLIGEIVGDKARSLGLRRGVVLGQGG